MELLLVSHVRPSFKGQIILQLTIISACQTKNVKLILSHEAFVIIADFRSACHVECQEMVSNFLLTDCLGGKEAWRPTHFS